MAALQLPVEASVVAASAGGVAGQRIVEAGQPKLENTLAVARNLRGKTRSFHASFIIHKNVVSSPHDVVLLLLHKVVARMRYLEIIIT